MSRPSILHSSRQTRHSPPISPLHQSQRYFDQYSPERQPRTSIPPLRVSHSQPQYSFDDPPAYDFVASPTPHLPESSGQNNYHTSSSPHRDYPDPGPPPPPPPPHAQGRPFEERSAAQQSISYPVSRRQKQTPQYEEQDPSIRARSLGYTNSTRTASTTTPGVDNLGDTAAGGGISGIAYGVAQANERESGVRALQAMQEAQRQLGTRPESMNSYGEDNPYVPEPSGYVGRAAQGRPAAAVGAYADRHYGTRGREALAARTPQQYPVDPFGSHADLSDMPRDAFASHLGPPGGRMASARPPSGTWVDTPYNRRSDLWDANVESFNPNEIEDDGDDALHGPARTGRRSAYPGIANRSHSSLAAAPIGAGAGVGAAVAGLANRDMSGKYGPVGQNTEYIGGHDAQEKDWEGNEAAKRKKRFWIAVGIGAVLVLAIVGAVIGGVYGSRAHASSDGNSAAADKDDGTALTSDSATIKSLMGDSRLHRVFPGIAYTPLNAQYPECLSNMPTQNNITKDVAILSQLTDTIRLYGTDCNQTAMVLEALNRLKITDVKLWLAVWLNGNATTNDRGINDMHELVKKYGSDPFKGVILGNEVLFRKELELPQILEFVQETRRNFSEAGVNLPIAVADLGDNWTAEMAAVADVVMSNVHPFFGGVPVKDAAGWAWTFWQGKDVVLTKGNSTKQNIISEIGWPSGGGNDCGVDGKCTDKTSGAVASVDNMNTFMEDFVCQSIKNGTDYFWFEAFDEPWKAVFNTADEQWETQWGLFDQDRKFKNGLKIPDCGGAKPAQR